MNKIAVDKYIPKAYVALETFGIAKNKEIEKTFRGYISSFGAAMALGSMRSSIAFMSSQNNAQCERDNLMKAIFALVTDFDFEKADPSTVKSNSLLGYVIEKQENEDEIKEKIYNASIAIKLAMNMYTLK